MGHHAVLPLGVEQRHDFKPCTPFVEMPNAERGEARVPVPLIRIKPVGRYGETAAVVHLDGLDRLFDATLHVLSFHTACSETRNKEPLKPQKDHQNRCCCDDRTGHQMLARDLGRIQRDNATRQSK